MQVDALFSVVFNDVKTTADNTSCHHATACKNGICVAAATYQVDKAEKKGIIDLLCVAPAERQKGIGQLFSERLIASMRNAGAEQVFLFATTKSCG